MPLRRWLEAVAAEHALSVAVCLRAIGLVSFCAFVSLHVQVAGLYGAHGIAPIARSVELVTTRVEHPMLALPSLFLIVGGSDVALHVACVIGELASLAMAAGALGALAPLVAYATYLSFVSLGAPFLPLQWDTLLTESLVVAAIASPATLRRVPLSRARHAHPLALFALWFLAARLMFASGWVKLASGDETWSALTALDYHFETQPLPTLLGYAMHFAPSALRRAGVVLTFVVELVLPFAIFFGRLGRRVAAGGFALLLVTIALTGNYGFFDPLALALTLALVDDDAIQRLVRRLRVEAQPNGGRPAFVVVSSLAATQMLLAAIALVSTLGGRPSLPSAVLALDEAFDPFRVANGYGLFAVMTRERPIVIFEGSEDGETWLEYDYRWQSGDPARHPEACMPHMPRLDWMIWFAGLNDAPEGWIVATEIALLEARPEVLDLFGRDPFHGRRPRFVRAVRYDYAFAPPGDSDWWMRMDREPFGPTLQRE
jgi:hypothetical protein